MSNLRRISNLFSRSRVGREIADEIRLHIEMRTEDNISPGMPQQDARRNALLRFGNPAIVTERMAAEDIALIVETLVGGQGLRLALGGVLLGVCGAFALTRVLQGLLFQVSTTDPLTYAGISFLFVVVAVAASYFPARRAAGIDPLATLRL